MITATDDGLDMATRRAAEAFLTHVKRLYPVESARLFGSRARGTHRADSDADIAVILGGRKGDRAAVAIDMAGVAFEVLLETGVLFEALPLWRVDLEHPETFGAPRLIENIQREGIPI